jgi:hypothetical protein
MNEKITDYIKNAPPGHREILEVLRVLILDTVEGVVEEFKWGRPVFVKGNEFAYLRDASKHVALGFYKGHLLEDEKGLLEGEGNEMRHIKLFKLEDIDREQLKKWIKDASLG